MCVNSPSENNLCLRSFFFWYSTGIGLQSMPLPRALCWEAEQEVVGGTGPIWPGPFSAFGDLELCPGFQASRRVLYTLRASLTIAEKNKQESDLMVTKASVILYSQVGPFRSVPAGMETWQRRATVSHTFPATFQRIVFRSKSDWIL